MREIKFRAWNKTTQTLEVVEEITYNKGKIDQINTDKDRILFPDKECELMQFTGLKDKNGKEIYEGDVVRFEVENQDMWAGGTRGEIAYEETEACFVIMNAGKSYVTIGHGYDAYPRSLEVIGNIYENPDLLKQEVKES
jgi:uncharacterized phage protein (TIGR01671 family)